MGVANYIQQCRRGQAQLIVLNPPFENPGYGSDMNLIV